MHRLKAARIMHLLRRSSQPDLPWSLGLCGVRGVDFLPHAVQDRRSWLGHQLRQWQHVPHLPAPPRQQRLDQPPVLDRGRPQDLSVRARRLLLQPGRWYLDPRPDLLRSPRRALPHRSEQPDRAAPWPLRPKHRHRAHCLSFRTDFLLWQIVPDRGPQASRLSGFCFFFI